METDEVRGRPLDPFGAATTGVGFYRNKENRIRVAPKPCMGD